MPDSYYTLKEFDKRITGKLRVSKLDKFRNILKKKLPKLPKIR